MNALIKTLTTLALLLLPLQTFATAASFKPGRGLSMDLWTTWPDESAWGDAGVILPFPEWRRFLDAGDLKALTRDGFTMVRLPVDPAVFLSSQTGRLHGRLMASVRDTVALIAGAGLDVIVDLHAIPGGENRSIGTNDLMTDEAAFERYVGLVRDMAALVADTDPAGVALELMNEPTADCSGTQAETWSDRLQRLVATARAAAPRTTFVVSGACWGGADGLVALDPSRFPDDNLVWSFHSYAPFILTHQGAGWTGDISPYATGLPYPPYGANARETAAALKAIRARVRAEAPWLRRAGIISFVEEELAKIDSSEELKAVIATPFDEVANWADRHGIARENILLGEFGMIRQEYDHEFRTAPAWRAAYYGDMIRLAEDHGFGWSLWGYGGAFGVIEAFEGKPAEPDVLDVIRGLPPR